MMRISGNIIIFSVFLLYFPHPLFDASSDTLTTSDSLSVNQTLISAGGKFELGFFVKGVSPKRYYVGIWYKDIPSPSNVIVWVANRNTPAFGESSTFGLGNESNIVMFDVVDEYRMCLWETNKTSGANNSILQLLDSGNLVMRQGRDGNIIWQSFDYPTDTLLPGQKLGWDRKRGLEWVLTAWWDPGIPFQGNFSFAMGYDEDPELYLKNGDRITYRSGPWVGDRFSGLPALGLANPVFNSTFITTPDETSYSVTLLGSSRVIRTRLVVTFDGFIERWNWPLGSRKWVLFLRANMDPCDTFAFCGSYGVCNASDFFHCNCPLGFKPNNSYSWGISDWSSGCVRKTKLECETDVFLPLDNIKLPQTSNVSVDESLSLDQCRDMCKKNCSCTAYANSKSVNGAGSGCILWTNNLIDMRTSFQGGQTLYIRLASSDLGDRAGSSSSTAPAKIDIDVIRKVVIDIGLAVVIATFVIGGLIKLIIVQKRESSRNTLSGTGLLDRELSPAERSQENHLFRRRITSKTKCSGIPTNADDAELPVFDLRSMVAATNNFSNVNKLGEGGFGCVYKGVMADGLEVAVKRLSKESRQGSEEFKNEIRLISKLHHRNLVRLLGCCVDMDEKMIIYEYLKNKSLDSFLFHKGRNSLLNWETRFKIICGVARGLLYLHQDSRYRVIHRDLKASNILLDEDMNPKISDFGMARIFGGDETQGNTARVVGTFGYMAPEFAMDGHFSIKSDVFSFGVLLLEILSGMKNRRSFNSDNERNLLGYSWKQWKKGKGIELVDKSMGEIYSRDEALRCLQTALLCVQEKPEDRPAMGSVVLMLSTESMSLPPPMFP